MFGLARGVRWKVTRNFDLVRAARIHSSKQRHGGQRIRAPHEPHVDTASSDRGVGGPHHRAGLLVVASRRGCHPAHGAAVM